MTLTPNNPYEVDLDRNAANHVPLSPLSFLRRTAAVYPTRTAVIHGTLRRTWAETYERCVRLAAALNQRGIGIGDTVAVMAPNTPEAFEAHFGVPMAGAVLNALNIRLDAAALAFMLDHAGARVLFTDREFAPVIAKALHLVQHRPIVIDIDDPQGARNGERLGETDYEAFLASGDPRFAWTLPADEWQAISLNYTSGTTGNPKGVIYHHRGAYLNSLGNIVTWAMPHHPIYLWTAPMFHCNGWCFPWTITAMAGTHVCLRAVNARSIYDAIADHGVTHLSAAPVVMGLLVSAPETERRPIPAGIRMMTAGSPPPASVIEKIQALGFDIIHVYGLSEVYGPVMVCAWQEAWDELPAPEQAIYKARQGVPYQVQEAVIVADPVSLTPVPADGTTIGEVLMRGNVVMRGYLKNPTATAEAFADGWFHTGDLAVMHENGYLEIKDRSKDIIISGAENISTVEVESVLYRHAAVREAAVVARPDEKWGETPCAFVTLRDGCDATEAELIAFCRQHLAHFKCPRTVVFTTLPKTSTGKIQKYALREQAQRLNEISDRR
ncbi:MAG: acyl-CoA synthetase [Azospirillaceae bacterium]|nr:acyl-CoA synthetase [Azospirillaceae bacterium]